MTLLRFVPSVALCGFVTAIVAEGVSWLSVAATAVSGVA